MSRKRSETRRRLLDSAHRLLVENGIGVRLEDIALDAGVSRQTVYLHFGSRHGLLVELFDYLDRTVEPGQAAESIQGAPNAKAALEALVRHRASYVPVIYPAARPLIAARRSDPAAEVVYQDRQAARRFEYGLLARRLESEGLLALGWTVEAAVEAMRALLSIPVWEQLVIDQGWTSAQYQDAMLRILRRTFVDQA